MGYGAKEYAKELGFEQQAEHLTKRLHVWARATEIQELSRRGLSEQKAEGEKMVGRACVSRLPQEVPIVW